MAESLTDVERTSERCRRLAHATTQADVRHVLTEMAKEYEAQCSALRQREA